MNTCDMGAVALVYQGSRTYYSFTTLVVIFLTQSRRLSHANSIECTDVKSS